MRRVSRRARRADLALRLGAKPLPELVALAHQHASCERLLSRKGRILSRPAARIDTRTAFTVSASSGQTRAVLGIAEAG
jgi:hypothetical protein